MKYQFMPRWLSLLIGPELLWLTVYGIITLLINTTEPPSPLLNDLVKSLSIVLPLVAASIFLLWYIPSIEKRWLKTRVWVVGLVGAHISLKKGLSAYSEPGPEIVSTYTAGMVLVFFVLLVGTLYILIRFRSRS